MLAAAVMACAAPVVAGTAVAAAASKKKKTKLDPVQLAARALTIAQRADKAARAAGAPITSDRGSPTAP